MKPHYLYLGSDDSPESLAEWVDAPPVIRPLDQVLDDAHTRFRAITKIIKDSAAKAKR